MAPQFNVITLYKVSFTERIAFNVVDVFVHAIESTDTHRTNISRSFLFVKVKAKFFLR